MSSTESTSLHDEVSARVPGPGRLVTQLFDEARAHERRRKLVRLIGAAVLIAAVAVASTLYATRSTTTGGLALETPQQSQTFATVAQNILRETPRVAQKAIFAWARTNGVGVVVEFRDTTNHSASFLEDGRVGGFSVNPPYPDEPSIITVLIVEHGELGCEFRQNKHLTACAGATYPY